VLSSKAISITPGSKGQITLSSRARQHLGLNKGALLTEVVVGNCVILAPQNRKLTKLMKSAHEELTGSGITVEELKAEAERQKNKRFAQQYPGLAK
jgi:bifunctional DNA-binding transcriptional regulator/antitoxin component of YhaV-PrlF toxin-antitoxin module